MIDPKRCDECGDELPEGEEGPLCEDCLFAEDEEDDFNEDDEE